MGDIIDTLYYHIQRVESLIDRVDGERMRALHSLDLMEADTDKLRKELAGLQTTAEELERLNP